MCFGGSSDNSEMINLEKQQAEEARKKEEDRQARIKAALERVKAAFEGTDTFKTVNGTPVTVAAPGTDATAGGAVSGLPAGYTWSLEGATPATTRQVSVKDPNNMANRVATEQVAGTPGTLMVKGPDGKLYHVGDVVTPTTQEKTGHSGGFDDSFFNKLREGITGYYLPQVTDQYKDARDELTYRLARAGLSRSTMANTEIADLVKQNKLNVGAVKDKAEKAVGDLKTNVANQRATAESQIMAAEDPDVSANSALAQVKNISAAPTDLSPLASVFNLAEVGTAGAIKQFNNQRFKGAAGGFNSGATRII